MRAFLDAVDGLAMSARESEITAASVWRSDYERYREIYEIAGDFSKRLRAHLIKAAREEGLSRAKRDSLFAVVTQTGDEGRGR